MLLQKIRLKGFLGHRSRRDGEDGADASTVIDLSTASLWLIHGPNGGGKSSLWDALTFALFKEHRGGGQNFAQLIHDADDEAEVSIEFVLGGELFMLKGSIARPKRGGSAKVRRSLWQWNGADWESRHESEKKIKEWVGEHLRMSGETFCSAVLLRQGEADRFIRALPQKRRDCLMELLQLDFYRELDRRAVGKRNLCSKNLERCEKALRDLNAPTEEQVETQRRLVTETAESLSRLGEESEEKKTALRDAERAAGLIGKIERARHQQQEDKSLLAEEERIEREASRFRELDGKVLPRLESLWAAQDRLAREECELEKAEREAASLKQDITLLSDEAEALREEERQAAHALTEARAALEQAAGRQQRLKDDLEVLAQMESFERDISEEEEKLKPLRPVLEERARIERDYLRHNELREAAPRLARLDKTARNLDGARADLEAKRGEAGSSEQQERKAVEDETHCRQASEQAEREFETTREELSQHRVMSGKLRGQLEQSEAAAEEAECPACGGQLDSNEGRTRLSHIIAHRREKLIALDDEQRALETALQGKEQARQEARSALNAAERGTQDARSRAGIAHSSFEHARAALERAKAEASEAQAEAGDWASRLGEYESLKGEIQELAAAPAAWSALEKAKRIEDSVRMIADNYRRRLDNLPRWSPEERQNIKHEAEACGQDVSRLDQQKDEAERLHTEARAAREGAENQLRQFAADLSSAARQAEAIRGRVKETEGEAASSRASVPREWANHPACDDAKALEVLRRERDELRGAEGREEELRAARVRRAENKREIDIYQADLDAIPLERQRSVADVEEELEAATQALECAGANSREAERRLSELERQQEAAARAREERNEAARESSYYKRLADSFGKHSLQAVIVQRAQEDIKRHANTILGRLTGSAWQVELKEDGTHTELEIQARDLTQPGTPTRPFEYLSGGEQFRVAISLAVAIGQSVGGGRTADTLVIDEGFGTLDNDNRGLLVRELQRLSEEVLSNGRVVVVSHQEDVCGEFGSRYRLSRDDDGYVRAERYATG
ncbi:MAG: SMC family ATPase [Acidobacteria bacterium]|nr:SMC family ATPase [Acidobacteriota bacterium]